ncbi:MAG: PHP domain-containing protein [Clostridia bacterium]|nr:PHP domain-containing protein [Clostridia bacterium]
MIDLHTHTTASDGSMSPREIVRHAKANGLSALAVTDHDTVDGLEDALDEGKKVGLEVIPGVEIGVEFKPEMHILGYFFNGYTRIKGTLDKLRENREERNPKIIRKLNEMGYDISMDEVKAEARGNVVGRPHIAKVLINKGYMDSMQQAFETLLGSGKPAYFKKDKLTAEAGIGEILDAGGVPVLAHPIYLGLDEEKLDILFATLKSYGLKGVETYYVDHSKEDTGRFLKLADRYGLVPTGGSDFHGSFKPDIAIGKGKGNLLVPDELLERLKGVKTVGI